jgi:uncharacterized protein (TIGR03000 family)
MTRHCLAATLAIAALAYCTSADAGCPKPRSRQSACGTATVVVTLPDDATLSLNGRATSSTGGTRKFVTPPLEAGRTYTYRVRAAVRRGGETLEVEQIVRVAAGRVSRVNLANFAAVGVAGNSTAGDAPVAGSRLPQVPSGLLDDDEPASVDPLRNFLDSLGI